MPRWIYNRPYDRCNETELEVARMLDRLGEGWTVRWGYYYDGDREGDFLVLGPTGGALVLEVKGGDLRRFAGTGRWETASGDTPLNQLFAEWRGVIAKVEAAGRGRRGPFIQKALALPDTVIGPEASEHAGINRELILDRRDLLDFVGSWNRRLFTRRQPVTREEREVFEEAWLSEATAEGAGHFISETDRVLLRHVQSSFEVLEMLRENRQLVVEGGPGTGKSWLAFEQACRWAVEGSRRVLLLCYNLALESLLRSLVAKRKLKRGEVVVRSWEALARETLAEAGIPWSVPDGREAQFRFFGDEVPTLLAQVAAEPGFVPRFDALVVDEAQDHDTFLPGSGNEAGWWTTYLRMLRGGNRAPMALFLDRSQRPLFRDPNRFDPDRLCAALERPVRVRLPYARRYARPVFHYLKGLVSDTTRPIVYSLHYHGHLPEGPDVEEQEAAPADIPAAVADLARSWVRAGYCRPHQILVLTPRSRAKSVLAGVESIGDWPLVDHDLLRPDSVAYLSVNRAKGLDSLAVILAGVRPFDQLTEPQEQMDYFLGASRARQLLGVIATPGPSMEATHATR